MTLSGNLSNLRGLETGSCTWKIRHAASGHNLYTKSNYVYLQRLAQLPDQHPEVQQHFENGIHVVRRGDRYWAGLSTDLVVEQVIMRSQTTAIGLTRDR